MTLFSWYLSSKQEKTGDNLIDKTAHVEGMWPIAKVRQNTQVQHQHYLSNKQANTNFLRKNEKLHP